MQMTPCGLIPLSVVFPIILTGLTHESSFVHTGSIFSPVFIVTVMLCTLVLVDLVTSTYGPCWFMIFSSVVINVGTAALSRKSSAMFLMI